MTTTYKLGDLQYATCAWTCPGFTVDRDTGAIAPCPECCGLIPDHGDDGQLDKMATEFFRVFGCKPKCITELCDPKCKGWEVFDSGCHGLEIERCDECSQGTTFTDIHAAHIAWRTFWRWRIVRMIREDYTDMEPGDFHGWAWPHGFLLVESLLDVTDLRRLRCQAQGGEYIDGLALRSSNGHEVVLPDLCRDAENDGRLSMKAAREWARIFVREMDGAARAKARAKKRRAIVRAAIHLVAAHDIYAADASKHELLDGCQRKLRDAVKASGLDIRIDKKG